MTRNGRHEPPDPAATPRDGVQSPVRPVVVGRGGLRQRAGIIAVAAVAITVVAAGVGLGGRGTGPVPSHSASASGRSVTAASGSPAASSATIPPPTEMPAFGCVPVVPGDLPEIRLWSTDGRADPVGGVPGPPDWALSSPPTLAWPVPNPRAALPLDRSASVVLIPDERACIRYAVAEYLSATDLGGAPTPLAPGEINVNPPRTRVVLGGIPPGDWIVRVVAYYSTGVAGNEDQAVMERFFRVFSGSAPQASPLIAPAVPCAPLLAGAPAPRLYLVAGDGEPILGVDAATYPGDILRNGAIVTGTFPDGIELRIADDACATSWDIRILDYANGGPMNVFAQENPGENPFFISQNRIELTETVLGRSVVTATVSFGRNRAAQGAWELTLAGPPPPAAELSGSNGARAAARPGCGVGWTLAIGRSAYEACSEYLVPVGLDVLAVRRGDTVRFAVPGWRILSWYVSCGDRSTSDGAFWDPAGCSLGSGGNGSSDAGPAIFLPFPGRHVVSVWISADRAGDTVNAQYFVEIAAER